MKGRAPVSTEMMQHINDILTLETGLREIIGCPIIWSAPVLLSNTCPGILKQFPTECLAVVLALSNVCSSYFQQCPQVPCSEPQRQWLDGFNLVLFW